MIIISKITVLQNNVMETKICVWAGWLLTDRVIDWLTDWRTDWLIDWLTNWLTGWLTDRLSYWLANDRVAYWVTDWLAGWLAGWPARLASWLVYQHWLACCVLFSNVGIPYIEVMIAFMVQLKDTSGTIVLFETIGGPPKSNHEERESIPRTILKTRGHSWSSQLLHNLSSCEIKSRSGLNIFSGFNFSVAYTGL